ncbi:MAG: phosphoserine phosphatase SerB [Pseudomonadota bacterium]
MLAASQVSMPHTAVMVAPASHSALKDEFAQTLANATGSGIQLLNLCPNGDDFAFETRVNDMSPQQALSLQKTLKKTLGTSADIAVLPTLSRRKSLLVTDMDSTIIAVECLDELADFAGKKDVVSAITERAMAGELNFEDALTERVAMLAGLPLEELQACFDQKIFMSEGARALVASLKQSGVRTVLVSGGFTFFTSRVAALLGFDDHRGNTLIDDGSVLTGDVDRPILGRDAKLKALEEEATALGLGLEDTLTLGDGANDLAMIEASGLGIAYHAKPIVAARARCAIDHTSLRTALYFQGYSSDEIVSLGD